MRKKYAVVFLLGGMAGVVYLVAGIFRSTNSTAALGILFLPIFFLGGAIALAVPAAAVFASRDILKGDRSTSKMLLAATAWVLVAYVATASVLWEKSMREAQESQANEESLRAALQRWLPFGRGSVESAVIQNPAVTPAILGELWAGADNSVKSQVLENPKTPVAILWAVARQAPDYFLHSALARNPALPPAAMEVIVENSTKAGVPNRNLVETHVLSALARREDLPPLLLEKIMAINTPSYFLVYALVNNEKATCAQARKFLASTDELTVREVRAAMRKKNCR
jgi:hypothetical protein